MFENLVLNNRSYRRFEENKTIEREVFIKLIDYARVVPSGDNKQTLRYFISCDQNTNDRIFPTLGWAAALPDWPGPAVGERPAGYIVIVQGVKDKTRSAANLGVAAQTILLGAVASGLGGCMINNVKRTTLKGILNIDENYEILLVIALGQPKETVIIEEIDLGADTTYWRDDNQVHHVPKLKLDDIILNV